MSIEYKDLSGGQTDNITTGNPTQGAIVENFVVTRDRKLETRRGFEVFDSAASFESVVRATAEKIGELKSCINNSYLLIRKAADVYFKRLDNGVWQKVVSPNATQKAFWTANENSVTRMIEWAGQVYGVAHNNPANPSVSDFLSPMRIYPDNATPELVQVRNMSPPQVPDPYSAGVWLDDAITLANEIRAKLSFHMQIVGLELTASAASDRLSVGMASLPSYLAESDAFDLNLIWFDQIVSGAGGLSINTPYYIRNVSGGTFQVSLTPTGPIIDITSDGSVRLGFHSSPLTPILPPVATDLQSLITLTSSLVYYYNLHLTNGYLPGGRHDYLCGSFIISEESITGFRKCAEVLNKLKCAFNAHLLSSDANNVSLRQHIGVNYQTIVPANCDMILSPFVFTKSLNDPDLLSALAISGRVTRENFTFPVEANSLIRSAIISYNIHVGSLTQHTVADFANRIKYNNTYEADSTYAVNNLRDIQLFSHVIKLVYGFNSHRSKGGSIHSGSEPSTTEINSGTAPQAKEVIDFGILYENTELLSATDFTTVYQIVRQICNKLAVHSLYTSGGRHLLSVTPSSLAIPVKTLQYFAVSYALTYISRAFLRGGILFESESYPQIIEGVKECVNIGSYNNSTGAYTPNTTLDASDSLTKALINISSLNTDENQSSVETKLRVYRTIDNGTVYYLIREGDFSTVDETTSDEVLQSNAQIYTTGGVLGNDPAPKSKCFEIINNKAYFGGIVEVQADGTKVFLPRRLRQSKQNELSAAPESFFVDLESDIETIGRAGEYPIVVCKKGVYRIEGEFNDDGTGFMIAKKISDNVGGVSVNGGVTVNDVFFFAGNDGFYMSDASTVRRISSHLKTTYESLQTKHYIQCKHDRENNRIMWAARKTADDNDTIFVLDPKFGEGDELCIYEWNGESFRPHAIEHHNSQNIIGDIQGFVFKQTNATSDPKIDRTGSGSITGVNPIVYRFRSIAESFQNASIRKWATRAYVVFEKLTTNLSSQLRSVVDITEGKIKNMKYVIERSDTYPAGYQGSDIIPVKRTFPAKHLRSFFRQIEVALGKKTDDSSTVNTATITGTNVVISSGNWPANCNGKYLAFSNDNYIEEYLIVSGQGTNTLVVATAPGNASGLSWGIRSYPTDERARILAISMEGENTGRNLFPSKGGDSTSP